MLFNHDSDLVGLLQTFSPLFSQRVWPYAQALLLGAVLAPGKRTVSSILRVLGLSTVVRFQNYHRVLNRAQWSARLGAHLLFRELVRAFGPSGPLVFGLDETIERRWGRRIAARGIYRDAARSSKAVTNKTSGLRWLSVQLLARVPWAQRIWALPFLSVLAPSARYYEKRGRQPKKLTDRAKQVILQVQRWAPHRTLIFLGDSAYAVLELLAWCKHLKVILITTLRLDANLFAPAPKPRRGQAGRPRLKGQALPKLSARLKSPKTTWQRIWVDWYRKGKRKVEVTTGIAVWYHSGKVPVPIRWVLVRDPLGKFETRALLSTCLSQSAREIVQLYTRRWQVEVTFEETRAHLGFETQRQWNPKAIQRATPVVLGLFSLVTLMAHRLQQRAPGSLRPRGAAWYPKRQISFSDALGYVRGHLWKKDFCMSVQRIDRRKFNKAWLNHLADLLCHSQ
jgi:DDE superfamily endonuclease